jgi:hypothetical protein
MSWTRNLLLVLVSFVVGFLIVELLTRAVIGHPLYQAHAASRVMLYEKGNNFQNVGRIFKYYPHVRFRISNNYVNEDDGAVTVEYAYTVRTNNLGLVQNGDIDDGSDVTLLLGDSFTEGQGAAPWFYALETERKDRKLVNGGILGTGPLQWKLLYDHLVRDHKLAVKKLIIIAIGPDIVRPVWNFSAEGLNCLTNANCDTFQGDWFGFDFGHKSDAAIQDEIRKMHRKWTNISLGFNMQSLKNLLKKSAFLYTVVRLYEDTGSTTGNLEAIDQLAKATAPNVALVLIPTKSEARDSGDAVWEADSEKLMDWSKEKGIPLTQCQLVAADYHRYDGHPNAQGYEKVRSCVEQLM